MDVQVPDLHQTVLMCRGCVASRKTQRRGNGVVCGSVVWGGEVCGAWGWRVCGARRSCREGRFVAKRCARMENRAQCSVVAAASCSVPAKMLLPKCRTAAFRRQYVEGGG